MSEPGEPKDATGPDAPLTASEAEATAAAEAATEVAEAEASAAAADHEDHGPGGGNEGAHEDGGHDAHGSHHDEEPLGPIDVRAWLAGLVGVAAALVVVAAFAVAVGLV